MIPNIVAYYRHHPHLSLVSIPLQHLSIHFTSPLFLEPQTLPVFPPCGIDFSCCFYFPLSVAFLWLQVAAYDQAKLLVWQRQAAIEQLAAELTSDPQETVQGQRIVEVIETTAVADADLQPSNGVWTEAVVPNEEQSVRLHDCARLHPL